MVYYCWNNMFGSNLPWVILVYWNIILLFSHPAILKQTISLKPILGKHNPNNWLYRPIGRWSICNMLHQYYTIVGCRYETNANIADGNSILSQRGLTRERQANIANGKPTSDQYVHVVWVARLSTSGGKERNISSFFVILLLFSPIFPLFFLISSSSDSRARSHGLMSPALFRWTTQLRLSKILG